MRTVDHLTGPGLAGRNDADALPTAERTNKLEALKSDRLELELREERLVLEAEAAGVRLDRRGDLSPAVYLETVL